MSEIYPIAVPKWGIEMVEGTINTWNKAEGDSVSKGDEVMDPLINAALPDDPDGRDRIHSQRYLFTSAGPDKVYLIESIDGDPEDDVNDNDYLPWFRALVTNEGAIYDPTNGTLSEGDIGHTHRGLAAPTLAH